jgi:very-short-patch-repair endonuclease
VRRTRELVEYLREFVRSSYKPVRDCAKYQQVLWLAGLPNGVMRSNSSASQVLLTVKHHPVRPAPSVPDELQGWVTLEDAAAATPEDPPLAEVGPGEGWVEDEHGNVHATDEIRREEAPEVLRAYTRWLSVWRRWSQAERAAAPHRELHQKLFRIATRVEQDGEVFEAVLATGLLTIGSERKTARVCRHILTVPLVLTVDPDTVQVTVSLSPDDPARLEDGDFLDESDGYSSRLLRVLRSRVDSDAFHPLSDDARDVLRAWSERAFGTDRAARFDSSWDRPTTGGETPGPQVTFAPAVVLRERGQGAMVSFYDGIARRMAQPGAQSPLGLAQLLYKLEPEERMAWGTGGGSSVRPALGPDPLFPLVANEAQREVLRRLQKDTGVVVQGPPGTGKTHTIANLISALLADGKRVLVTSEKAQALKVLRDQLPVGLRNLCVLQGDRRQDGGDDLGRSVRALSQISATVSPERLAERIAHHEQDRTDLAARAARLRDDLRSLREAEWREHPESSVARGYGGRLDEIVKRVTAGAPRHGWMPPFPAGSQDTPPLSPDEAQCLLSLVDRHGAAVLDERGARCPDPAELPAPLRLEELVNGLDAALRACGDAGSEPLVYELADQGPELIDTLAGLVDSAEQALQQEGMPTDPAAWPSGEWHARALRDGLGGRRQQLWDGVRRFSSRAEEVQKRLVDAWFPEVEVPELASADESHLTAASRDLHQFLRDGGRLRKWPPRRVQKEAQILFARCRVNGRVPSTADEVGAVVLHLEMRQCVRQLNERWDSLGVPTAQGSPEVALSELLDRVPQLRAVEEFTASVRTIHETLLRARVKVTVRAAEQWENVRQATVRARQLLLARRAELELAALVDTLPQPNARQVPELADVHRAAAARDPRAYEAAIENLTRAYHREADRREARKLLERLAEGHPALARRFTDTPTDPSWDARFAALGEAWAWRRARAFQDHMLTPGREAELEEELADVEARLKATVEQLAADRAMRHCLTRMTTGQKQALSAYATSMSHAGKGMTAQGKRHLNAARSAMRDARGAVPAWVMPVKQVAEMIAPEPDAFDVVIVDEASQVGLDGLMLLWLASRVIVVGDDRQCVPYFMGSKHDRIYQKVDERLPDLAAWQRDGLGPKSNLYELLSARFTEVIRLTEHFRCMPEIIKWSSAQFYPDNELVPLRQYGADRLKPLEVVHVREGHCEGLRERLVNRPEAERIVAKLQELTDDDAYAKRSFGVIVLRSGAQVRLLEDLIDTQVDPAVRERHRIRVGTAEQFQGDERDVILLSMVIDGDHTRALTSQNDRRRFNVAASRARDQMWLFTSVTADQLRSTDLRHSLLTYMQSPPALQSTPRSLATVSPDQRCEPFQSMFEQRVFFRIKERGYRVVPQWEVSGKFIDLVVIGENGRLAVECDGSPYHSSSRQIRDDYERERELRRAGWQFWRVRSSEFALDPEAALTPLWQRLDSLDIRPGAAPEEVPADQESFWVPVALDDGEPADDDRDTADDEPAY